MSEEDASVSDEDYARILNFEELAALRSELGTIVCTSGGFDPLHPGHASCLIDSKKFGDTLVVVVNGDSFLADVCFCEQHPVGTFRTRLFPRFLAKNTLRRNVIGAVSLNVLRDTRIQENSDCPEIALLDEYDLKQQADFSTLFAVDRRYELCLFGRFLHGIGEVRFPIIVDETTRVLKAAARF